MQLVSLSGKFNELYFIIDSCFYTPQNSCFEPVLEDVQTLAGLVGLFGIDLNDLASQAPSIGMLTGVVCGGYVEKPATNCPNTTAKPTTINYGMTTKKPTSTTTKKTSTTKKRTTTTTKKRTTTTKKPTPTPTISYGMLSKDCQKYYNNAKAGLKDIAKTCKLPKGYETAQTQIAKSISAWKGKKPTSKQYEDIMKMGDALFTPYCDKKGKCMTALNGDYSNVQKKVRQHGIDSKQTKKLCTQHSTACTNHHFLVQN